ncbi:MAG: PilZ domain-containing protein [Pseudomonadota bacterium]
MADNKVLLYSIKDPVELNLSYMPFLVNGGLFIPSFEPYTLGDEIVVELQLPGKKDSLKIEGKIVWITPSNALHHVLSGIGIQFIGPNAANNKTAIESQLDKTMEIGGYTYGMTEEPHSKK